MASRSSQIVPLSSCSSSWKYEAFLSFHGKNTRYSFTDHVRTDLEKNGIIVFRDDSEMERGEEIATELFKTIEESLYAIVVISENYASSKWCLKELTRIMHHRKEGRMKVFPVFYHVDPSDVRNLRKSFEKAFIQHRKERVDEELLNLWTATLEEVGSCIVKPSDIRASARSRNVLEVETEPLEKWRSAFTEAGSLAGWHVHNNSPESRVIKEISRKVLEGRMRNLREVPEFLVGMESQVIEMWRLLELGSADVRFVGICGMEGIGKTTLARVIYERVSSQFEGSCFVAEIGEASGREVVPLQKYLISKILTETAASMLKDHDPVDEGIKLLASLLTEKRVFIVLDDVRQGEQIKALAGRAEWFGGGSRILITSATRDLPQLRDDNIYDVKELSRNDAEELFYHNAVVKLHPVRRGEIRCPQEEFMGLTSTNLIDLILDCASGHPLAVGVFGSCLGAVRKEDEWKDYVERSITNLDRDVSDKLKIPFNGLGASVQQLFIDIACFFNKWYEDRVISKLKCLGYSSESILRLEHKCLIKFSQDRQLLMHGLLEKMGKEFAEGSRLWHIEDVISVSRKKSEIGKVVGVALKPHLTTEEEQLCYDVFSKMESLRMLRISLNDDDKNRELRGQGVDCGNEPMGGYRDSLSFKLNGGLRLMEWSGYPLRSLSIDQSSTFLDLVELNLRHSLIEQLWDGNKNFRRLKHVDLRSSKKLIKIPNLSQASELEVLDLSFCECLKEVDSSIGGLKNLKKLLLSGCHELRELPEKLSSKYLEVLVLSKCSELKRFPDISCSSHCLKNLDISETAIEESASSKVGFSSLEVLNLSCSRISDEAKPLDFSGLNRLQALDLSGNFITKLPDSLRGASNLQQLSLDGCRSLRELSVSLFLCLRLSKLSLSNCNLSDDSIPGSISCWYSILSLDLSENGFTKLPENMPELSKLEKLTLDGCRTLRTLPKLPLSLRSLHLRGCSLETSDCSRNSPILGDALQKSFRFCTVAYVGFGSSPYKILYLHSQSPPYTTDDREHLIEPRVVCGHTFRDEIPNEFIQERDRSDKEARIQMVWQSDDEGPSACALWIVYLVTGESQKRKLNELGSSNIGACKDNNHIFPEFFCQLQLNETSPEQNPQLPCQSQPNEESPVSFVIRVPKVARVGPPYRAWVFIVIPDSIRERKYKKRNISESLQESKAMKRWSYSASVRACSENVGLVECRARLFGGDATTTFSQFKSSICASTLDEQSLNHALEVLSVTGRIGVVSESDELNCYGEAESGQKRTRQYLSKKQRRQS